MAEGFRQEMPPKGGYGPIEWAKKIPRKGMPGFAMFGGFVGITALSWVGFYFTEKDMWQKELEMTDARVAVSPLILAEQNRLFLKQMRKNRDEENELMKDHPGWVTGTLYGEPVLHNIRGRYVWPCWEEYYAHNSWWDMYNRVYEKLHH